MAKRKPVDPPAQAFLATCRQQFLTADEAESNTRKEGLTDLKFLNLEQWPAEIKASRETVGQERPCLTIDQIGEPYRQLTNKVREARSSIRIMPEDGDANKKTAERLQELVRGIEYASDAQIAYVTAFEGAAGPGWGYARIRTEYEDPSKGRDQCIKVEAIENQFAVWIDPAAKEPDRRDMRFAFVAEAMPLEAYKAKYGESLVATQGSRELFQGIGNDWKDWFPEGKVITAEYYYRDDTTVAMVELASGQVMPKADYNTLKKVAEIPDEIVHEWDAATPVVKWAKINGLEILEGNDDKTAGRRIPGTTIPIRPCYGQQLHIDGTRIYRGIVRAARDPQQMYNYNNSALVEDLALVPKTKVFMAEGQEEGHEGEWQQILSAPAPYVRYKPTALGDKLVPPPQVAQFTDPAKIQSLVIAINQNKADLRSTLSYYDPSDPARKNTDQSGKAILARSQEMEQGNTGYLESYSRFLTSLGKLIVEWIPEVYDRKGRVVRGMDMEDNPSFLMLNQPYRPDPDGMPQALDEQALALGGDEYEHIDLSKGKYGVKVTVGKSYLTQKSEAAENGLRLMEVLPNQAPMFADVVVRNLDGPGNDQIADRLERTVPPQIKGDDKEQQNNPEMLQAENQQLQMKLQEMGQVIQGLQEAVKTDQVKVDGQKETAQLKARSDAMIEQAKLAEAEAKRMAEIAIKQQELEIQREELALKRAEIASDREIALAKLESEERMEEMKQRASLELAEVQAANAQQPGPRKVTKTIKRGPTGAIEGSDEVHEGGA